MRTTRLALTALLACGSAFAQQLTLDDAIQLALKSNRTIKNAVLEASKFDDRRAVLKSQMLPSVQFFGIAGQPAGSFDFNIPKGTLGVDSGGGSNPQNDVSIHTPARPFGVAAVTVIQPLSSIPTIRKGLGLLEIQKKMAEEQTRLERQSVVRDVRQLYYGIQTLQSSLRATRESVRLFQEVVRLTSQYAEKRQVLDVDYLDAQVQLAKVMESVLDLENQRETLKARLNLKLGRGVMTVFGVPDIPATADASLPDSLDDEAEARQRALLQRPEARQAQLKIEQARAEIRIAGAAFDPTVAAQYIGIQTTPINSLLPKEIGIAGVSLTWEPFTWGRKKHDSAMHRAELEEAVNKEQDAKEQVEIDVGEQFRRLQLAAARLHVASLSRQMANESLRVAQKQYEVQFSLLKTVLQAQSALEGSNAEFQRSLGELWAARAEYERALGDEQ
jgi:outer membrane protein TolC